MVLTYSTHDADVQQAMRAVEMGTGGLPWSVSCFSLLCSFLTTALGLHLPLSSLLLFPSLLERGLSKFLQAATRSCWVTVST